MDYREYRKQADKKQARRRKGTPEADLVRDIRTRLSYIPSVDLIRMNTGGLYDHKGQLITFGYPGMADLYIRVHQFRKPAATLWIEVKSKDGVQSANQKAFEALANRWGDRYCVVRSVEEAVQAVVEVSGDAKELYFWTK